MNFTIDKKDLKEIENKASDLTGWLLANFSSFNACAFILQTVMNGVAEAKKILEEDNENGE